MVTHNILNIKPYIDGVVSQWKGNSSYVSRQGAGFIEKVGAGCTFMVGFSSI